MARSRADLVKALRAERSVNLEARATGASDEDLDAAIEAVSRGDRAALAAVARSVVDRWSLTAVLSEAVVAFARSTDR